MPCYSAPMTRFAVVEFPDGFRLEAEGLCPVTARLEPWALVVCGRYSVPCRSWLHEGRAILRRITAELVSDRSLLESWPGIQRGPGADVAGVVQIMLRPRTAQESAPGSRKCR